jgi:glucan phosphoethanolaminetransferase (alkaline phosphatase superfamily)
MDDIGIPEDDDRGESPNQKLDRNWMELLQELRVLQTGVQILAGFLLTLPFQAKFATLDSFQVGLYLFNVMAAALTTSLILLPVSVHRRLFRKRLKSVLVASADAIAKTALFGVAVLIVGTAVLVYDVVAGRGAALVAGAAIVLVLLFLLLAVPVWLSFRSRRPPGPDL